jgi:dephospho-CoA kinase
MYTIGITGGIGSGKSTVAKCFSVLGIPIFNADEVAKKIMQTNTTVQQQIIETFGATTYQNNILNKQLLANLVFENAEKLSQLNAIVHPATIQAAKEFIAAQKSLYVIKEAALLFEAGTAADVDFVIGVSAPNHIRIKRAMHRDASTREQVLQRMEKQLPESLKMKLCNAVIINDDSSAIIPQVLQLHEQFLKLAETKA